ncbi:MAG: Na/Pi cotransporter family protein [Lachnospiraceae bacterium]|nr:Na/Pi cotransporter family protein [Lachnospiraceae bacterium]
MSIVLNTISLFGGLAMFLYGMRLMGANLKEGSSGTLKLVMEKVTNNHIKAFFLGLVITAIIQSSTATIVITSGLVAAGIISLDQSLGIIIGANVGTTITGQIIRLLDVNAEAGSILQFFQPSTLAPLALTLGMILIMGFKFKKSDSVGSIAVGFGILFSGLLNMTSAVSSFASSGIIDKMFANLGDNPFLGYLTGAGIAFVLQSSSATVGILQAFSMAGDIPFKTLYVMIVGVYLGDCVTTGIVCSIGAKPDAKRVGIVNILYNICKTILVVVVVAIVHKTGLLDTLWNQPMRSGGIANMNTIFNLGCAALLIPIVGLYKKLSYVIIRKEPEKTDPYASQISALNPVFFSTPALALRSCYDILTIMFNLAYDGINRAFGLITSYDEKIYQEIQENEEHVDHLTDCEDNYLVQLSPHTNEEHFIRILTQYHKLISEFEHLGDDAVNIADAAKKKHDEKVEFTETALKELALTRLLLNNILEYAKTAFEKRDVDSAYHIEPLEEVMNDLIHTLHDNHLARLREGSCSVRAGILLMEILTNLERIADTCSNIGVATIVRVHPEKTDIAHTYISSMHQGNDSTFNREYQRAHELYFTQLPQPETPKKKNKK